MSFTREGSQTLLTGQTMAAINSITSPLTSSPLIVALNSSVIGIGSRDSKVMTWNRRNLPNQRSCFLF